MLPAKKQTEYKNTHIHTQKKQTPVATTRLTPQPLDDIVAKTVRWQVLFFSNTPAAALTYRRFKGVI